MSRGDHIILAIIVALTSPLWLYYVARLVSSAVLTSWKHIMGRKEEQSSEANAEE